MKSASVFLVVPGLAALVGLGLLRAADQPVAPAKYVVIPERNPVNLTGKLPTLDFAVKEGKEKNLRWKAKLGDHAYGGPTVGDGKVFVGTNNRNPRDPKIEDDKGILMCFDLATGKFLW